ncbi:oleosin-B6-like [Cervus elaphus]|uniref:oleosin-B6-like n=1 Tax=Cervus canadensis TaxID=1574408 RepID=UPI001C9E9C9D|nr:oleosin-B6-like [Cervus canadensis]XP_043756714.1 oleosin-B6-like [Cervus elaphus]
MAPAAWRAGLSAARPRSPARPLRPARYRRPRAPAAPLAYRAQRPPRPGRCPASAPAPPAPGRHERTYPCPPRGPHLCRSSCGLGHPEFPVICEQAPRGNFISDEDSTCLAGATARPIELGYKTESSGTRWSTDFLNLINE